METNQLILHADMILQGKELTPVEKGALVVENERICDIFPQHVLDGHPIEDARELCFPGQTLMPGTIECYNHLYIDATLPGHLELLEWSSERRLTILALKDLKEDLLSGATTTRCMGDKYYIDVAMRKMIQGKKIKGPRLLATGIGVRGSHGAGYIGSPHCGAEEIRDTCRKNMKEGVDLLKFFVIPGVPDPNFSFVPSFLSPEEIAMTANEGARLRIPVAAYYIGGQSLKDCIEDGVQVVKHVYMITGQDMELLAASNCVVDLASGTFLDPSREALLSPSSAKKVRLNRSRVRKNIARILKTGLPLVPDTGTYHGYLYREVEYAVELGTDTVTALQGVTSHTANIYGLDHKLGSLAPGLATDIIVVKDNPLEQVSCLSQVGLVVKDGTIYKQ